MTYHPDNSNEGDINGDEDINVNFEEDDTPEEETEETEPKLAGIDPAATQPWHHKVREIIEHVTNVSKKCCKHPGFVLLIDEMMKCFKEGRPKQTYMMKNKPISEGKSSMHSVTAPGIVFDFFLDGRGDTNTIAESVGRLVDTIPR
jgi:hypothetical protein